MDWLAFGVSLKLAFRNDVDFNSTVYPYSRAG